MSVDKTLTIPGLVNGTAYKVKVKATQLDGSSEVSNTMTGTPLTTAGAPSIHHTTPGDRQVSVFVDPPANTGGAPITNYQHILKSEGRVLSPLVLPEFSYTGPRVRMYGGAVMDNSSVPVSNDYPTVAFPTTGSYLKVIQAPVDDYNFDGPFTFSGYFKVDSAPTVGDLSGYGYLGGLPYFVLFSITGGHPYQLADYSVHPGGFLPLLTVLYAEGKVVVRALAGGMETTSLLQEPTAVGSWFHLAVGAKLVAGELVGRVWLNGVGSSTFTLYSRTSDIYHRDRYPNRSMYIGYDGVSGVWDSWDYISIGNTLLGAVSMLRWDTADLFNVDNETIVPPVTLVELPSTKFLLDLAVMAPPTLDPPTTVSEIIVPELSLEDYPWLEYALSPAYVANTRFRLTTSSALGDTIYKELTVVSHTPANSSGVFTNIRLRGHAPYASPYPAALTAPADLFIEAGLTLSADYTAFIPHPARPNWTARYPASTTNPLVITGLTNGQQYRIAVRAVTSAGTGAATADTLMLAARPPEAPTITGTLTPEPLNGTLTVYFNRASNGGATVTSHEFSLNGGASWATIVWVGSSTGAVAIDSLRSSTVISGLIPNASYNLRLRQVNLAGEGSASGILNFTYILPAAPPVITATDLGNQQLSLVLSPGVDSARDPATNFRYSIDNGVNWIVRSPASAASPMVVKSLINGQAYIIRVQGINAGGPGLHTNAPSGTPRTSPGVAVITPPGTGAAYYTGSRGGNSTLYIVFTAPPNGGSEITALQYSAIAGTANVGATWLGVNLNGLPFTLASMVPGQTYTVVLYSPSAGGSFVNGTAYAVRLRFANVAGPALGTNTAGASALVMVTAGGRPGPVVLYSVTSTGVGSVVNAVASVDTGGSAITSVAVFYVVWPTPNSLESFDLNTIGATTTIYSELTNPLPITLPTFGERYVVALRANNAAGLGIWSGIQAVTALAPPRVEHSAVAGNQRITFYVDPSSAVSNRSEYLGGAAVTGYEYTFDGGTTPVPAPTHAPYGGSRAPDFEAEDFVSFVVTGLTNGTQYATQVRAVNSVGAGPWSAVVNRTPSTVPSPPTITVVSTGVSGNLQVTVTLGDLGGGTVLDYRYTVDDDEVGAVVYTNPFTISYFADGATPLIDGQSYSIRVAVVTTVGSSAPSVAVTGTPYGVPTAPTITTIDRSSRQLVVNFTPPVANGGRAITGYQYSLNAGSTWQNTVPVTSSSPLTVPNLTNATAYSVRLRAVNATGNGTASATVVATPAGAPITPSITRVDRGAGGGAPYALVYVSRVNTNGEFATFTVESSLGDNGPWILETGGASGLIAGGCIDGCGSGMNTVPPINFATQSMAYIPGLTSGQAYTVRLRYSNAFGSTISAPFSFNLYTPPASPSNPLGSGWQFIEGLQASIQVTLPTDTGGTPLTALRVFGVRTLDAGANLDVYTDYSPTSPITLPRAQQGTTGWASDATSNVIVWVGAVNAQGFSTPARWQLHPQDVPESPSLRPPAPFLTNVTASSAASGALTVSFAQAAFNRGAIHNFEYSTRLNNSGVWSMWRGLIPSDATSPITVPGLTNGQLYAVRLRAVNNDLGAGAVSNILTGTPAAPMNAPVLDILTPGNGAISLVYSQLIGGQTILSYQATLDDGATHIQLSGGTASTLVISGLANGATYSVRLRAVSALAVSAWSNTLSTTLAPSVPAAPTLTGITAATNQLSIAFTPGFDNGSAIVGYRYSTDNGTTWATRPGTANPVVITSTTSTPITSLANGTAYTIRLKAYNATGEGVSSNALTGIPAGAPLAPPTNVAVRGEGAGLRVTLTTVSQTNGSPITNYEYSTDNGVSWKAQSPASALNVVTITQTSAPGTALLVNNTSYIVLLRAVNAIGAGPASVAVPITYWVPQQVFLGDGQGSFTDNGGRAILPGSPVYDAVTGQPYVTAKAYDMGGDQLGAAASAFSSFEYNLGTEWRTAHATHPAAGNGRVGDYAALFIDSRTVANGNALLGLYQPYTVQVRAVNAAAVKGIPSAALTLTPHPWEPAAPTLTLEEAISNGKAKVILAPVSPITEPDTIPAEPITTYSTLVGGIIWELAFSLPITGTMHGSTTQTAYSPYLNNGNQSATGLARLVHYIGTPVMPATVGGLAAYNVPTTNGRARLEYAGQYTAVGGATADAYISLNGVFAISCKFYCTAYPTFGSTAELFRTGGTDTAAIVGMKLELTTNGDLRLHISSLGASYNLASDLHLGSVALNVWEHIVITRTAQGKLVCYLGGLKVYSEAFSGDIYRAPLSGGVYGWIIAEGFRGGIREFKIYSGDVYTSPYAAGQATVSAVSNSATKYGAQYRVNGGAWVTTDVTYTGALGRLTVPSLTNGVTYSIQTRYVASTGALGGASNSLTATPQTLVPYAPSIVRVQLATIGGGPTRQATIFVSPPSDNGGANITNYQYALYAQEELEWDGSEYYYISGTDEFGQPIYAFPLRTLTYTAVSPVSASGTISAVLASGIPGYKLYVRVKAVNSLGAGIESAPAWVTIANL